VLLALYAALMTMALGVQSKTLSVGSWFAYFAGFAWPAVLTTFRRIAKWPRSPRLSDWS
jgi:hypothetical protein